ncbi:MAG: hypothetical protein QNK19_05515 [Xanthomonadales bacterium]|nr:hypothetical protein [Xanthomonadales bacterium]
MYYLALTYHDQQDCVSEQPAMQAVIDGFPTSIYAVRAQTHVDAIVATDLAHIC